jgi:Zn-dependent peptidase ImmA (M78 family)
MRLPSPPWLDYESIRNEADNFLQKHWPEGVSPVDVEKIVDARLGIDIIEYPGLQREIGVDGFLSRSGKSIYVDMGMSNNVSNRHRFTLAHELGHLVLHGDLYRAAEFSTPAEWLRVQSSLPERDYSRYEFQAYCFGGLILAPRQHLSAAVDEAVALAARRGYNINLDDAADREFAARWVARELKVSEQVVLKRGKYDGLWDDA